MKIVEFINNGKTVVAITRDNEIRCYDKKYLEFCIGRGGGPIFVDIGDIIQGDFDKQFKPRIETVPPEISKKYSGGLKNNKKNNRRY